MKGESRYRSLKKSSFQRTTANDTNSREEKIKKAVNPFSKKRTINYETEIAGSSKFDAAQEIARFMNQISNPLSTQKKYGELAKISTKFST